jgi:2-aminoadipate transaminase
MSDFVKSIFRNAVGSPIRELKKYSEIPGMISLAGGYPAPELMDAQGVQQVVGNLSTKQLTSAMQYGGTEGSKEFRATLATISQERELNCHPDEILVLSGSQQGIDLVARVILEPGDVVFVEAPTYPAALSAFRLAGATIHQLPSDKDGMIVSSLDEEMRRLKPKLLYLVPTFGNPSGRTLPLERRTLALQAAVRNNCVILEDDPYSELWFSVKAPPPIYSLRHSVPNAQNHCIYISSLSKTLAPALRLGWMLAPPTLLRAAVLAKQSDDMHASTLNQAIAATYIDNGTFADNLPRLRKFYKTGAEALCQSLHTHMGSRVEFDEPGGGMFVWARVDGIDTSQWLKRAIAAKAMFVPGVAFFASPDDTSWFRLSFASLDPDGIDQGIKRLSTVLDTVEA